MTLDLSGGGNIGGKSFESLGLLLTGASIPFLPETRQTEEEIPNMDGTLDLETTFGPRQLELKFEMLEDYEIDYHATLSLIASAFNPLKGKQVLVLERNPGKQYEVKYNGTLSIEKIATLGVFTIPLKAFNPFPKSRSEASPLTLDDGATLADGMTLSEDDYIYEVTASPTDFTVYHAGNHEVRPVIKITGSGSGITINNTTTGESLTYSNSLVSGDELIIDCTQYTAKKNGVNAFSDVSGDFPKLAEGDNAFTVSVTSPNLTIEYDFRHTYLY